MTVKEYRNQELEKFYNSQSSNMNENQDVFATSKRVKCKRVNMSSEEYIKSVNLHTYEEIKKKLML